MRARRRKAGATERLLALDTSSTCVGWAIFDNGELVQHGRVHQEGESHDERLHNFHHWLVQTLKVQKPDQVCYEKPFAGRRRFTFGVLSLYVAVVLLSHFEHFQTPLPEGNAIAAREVKRRNKMKKGANHAQNKKLAVLLVNQLYSLRLKYKSNDKTKKVSQDDQADAILLGRAWLLAERPWLLDQ